MARRCILAAGFLAALAVLLPPLAAMGQHLFAAHMAQHLLLIAVAAPLLVTGGVRLNIRPLTAWLVFVGIFLFWHWPAAFRWASGRLMTEWLEMLSILIAALLFWSAALTANALSYGGRALLVMTAAVATDLPGVVMVFSPTNFTQMPQENAAAFGLSLLADQQIAGLLMWVPANLVFFAFATLLFAWWLEPPSPAGAAKEISA
jgi:putative membrane protein